MTESQKEGSSAAQPKKKNPLDLDLDFEKDDFFSSWKSMSVTGDDTMDLDFGPISKGKKKAFNFDKSDMDFNLDDGFGKLPSFNLDIPDIDISSPAKKDGISKEKSTKESASGKTRGKTDHFDFSFDFNDMDGFNFEPTSKKEDKIAKGGEDKENSLNRMVSPKSKECPAENSDMHQSESRNLPVSDSLRTSKFDLQGCSSESNVNSPSNSANDDVSQRLPPPSVDEETSVRAATSIMKTSSSSNQEVNCQLDQLMSPVSHSPDIFMANENEPDNSIQSVSRNESSQDTVPEVVQEEASFLDTEALKLEKSANKKLIDDNSEISALGGSAVHDTAITEKEQPGKKDLTDNTALVTIKEGAEPVQSGTLVEDSLPAKASRELAHKSQVNVKNKGGVSSTLNSRTTADALMSEKERETVTRSKYFKQPDKTESQFRSTLNQPTQASVNDREVGTKQLCPPGGSKKHIPAESNSRLTGISSLHSTSVAGKEHAQRLESGREFTTNRPRDEDVIKEKHSAPAKGDKGIKSLHSFRSHVNTPSLGGLAIKSSSKDIANSTSQTMNVEATQNRKTSASAENQLSSVKAIKKMPTISALTTSRASGTNLDSVKSPAQKDSMLSRGVQQYKKLSGSTLSKTVEVAVTKMQTPITPSLKRKISEDCTMNMVLKPLKRQSGSPRSSVSLEVSGKVVDNKMACDSPNVAECRKIKNALEKQNSSSPTASNQVILNELEGPSSLDYDINIEMAEACSKGLDDICNLLSKKHEEAKELLVRAVVNNNRLLMLNHPIYEEKIRMVQKFATQLPLGEVHA